MYATSDIFQPDPTDMRILPLLSGSLILAATFNLPAGALVTPAEMARRDAWLKASFDQLPAEAPKPGLVVHANNDPVIKNGRFGKPMNLAGKEYTRGLYCHAVSKVEVRLPGPGKTFSAVVGVDSNSQTSGGRGSVVFSVNVQGREAYKSAVIHEGMPAVPVSVDLNGASVLTLGISDAGDGISCDQSDWADAKVVLADGKEIWLGDMPLLEEIAVGGLPFSFVYGGKSSAELLSSWDRKEEKSKLNETRTQRTITWTDKQTGLVLRCVAVEYSDFPTIEWTLYFKNTGTQDTPILSDILSLETWPSGMNCAAAIPACSWTRVLPAAAATISKLCGVRSLSTKATWSMPT
jgi:alpha-galactosidase